MTIVTHHTGDKNIKIAFHLSPASNRLSLKFLDASKNDKAFVKRIETAFIDMLSHRMKVVLGLENAEHSTVSSEDTKVAGKKQLTVDISLPARYRTSSGVVIADKTTHEIAKHPDLLRQVEVMLLERHNNLG